jgi:hypothetical protein
METGTRKSDRAPARSSTDDLRAFVIVKRSGNHLGASGRRLTKQHDDRRGLRLTPTRGNLSSIPEPQS